MQFDKFYSELELMAAFREGDREAAGVLFKQFYKNLVFFADQLVHDSSEAKDIVSDIFIKLFRKHQDFDNLANIKSFLYVATRNACYNHLSSIKIRQRSAIELMYLTDARQMGEWDFKVIDEEIMMAVMEEIEKLTELPKTILLLQYLKNFNAKQIASLLRLSVKTIYNKKGEAVKQIQVALLKRGITVHESSLYILVLSSMFLLN